MMVSDYRTEPKEQIEEHIVKVLTAINCCMSCHCDVCPYTKPIEGIECLTMLFRDATSLILFLNGKYLDYEHTLMRIKEQLSDDGK